MTVRVLQKMRMRVDSRSYWAENAGMKVSLTYILTNFSIALLCRFNFCYRTRCCFDGKIDQKILTTCHIELASKRFRKKLRKFFFTFGQFFYCSSIVIWITLVRAWTSTLRLNRRKRLLPYKLNLRLFFLLSKIRLIDVYVYLDVM